MPENPIITAVIPVRLSSERLYDEPERIARIIATLPSGYAPLIVDYGTGEDRAGELRDLATETGTRLVRVETGEEPFSVGHARDIGTQHAETPLILYHDIDFLMSPHNYARVLEEARLRGMPENAYTFFALPGAYMTEEFTQQYLELFARAEAAFADTLLHDGVMRRDRTIYENHTYAISAIVASRYHLLAIGGHDKSFVGHGAEDFELLHRLASYTPRGPKTSSYYLNTRKNSILRYEGFRAYFALYGIDVFQRGLQIAHLWHPRRQDTSYVAPMTENQERVSEAMADYDGGLSWLPSLEDPKATEYTLVLVKDYKAPPLKALRHAFPAFGRYRIRLEGEFADGDQLLRQMDEEGFTRTLFLNPYGNPHRRALYDAVKAAGRRLVVWDRGGLHDSWFFDPSGFLAESSSYRPEIWDKPLDAAARRRVLDWLEAHRDSPTLEENGARIGAEALGEQLGTDGRKVIFVALQRPEDTATRFFAGPCVDTDGFNAWIAHLAKEIDPRMHLVVAKKHPLEEGEPSIPGVRFVDADTHVMDLIDLAEAVVVINSGVGLLALANGKPVLCCGEAYYAHPGLGQAVSRKENLVAAVNELVLPDEEKRLRFFRYLIEDFYSFGAPSYVTAVGKNGEKIRRVTRILFSSIRGLTQPPVELGALPGPIPLRAPLYFSYGGREAVQEETLSINKLIGMGKTAYTNGDHAEGFRWFEVANRRQPDNKNLSHAITAIARQTYEAGQRNEALRLLDRANDWVPGEKAPVHALADMGKSAHVAGNSEEAIHLLEIAHNWSPEDRGVYRALIDMGKAAHAAGNIDETIRLFEIARNWAPEDRGLLRMLVDMGKAAHAAGDSDVAVRLLEVARNWSPEDKGVFRALIDMGKAAHAAGNIDETIRLFEIARNWAPEDRGLFRMLIDMGKAERTKKRYGEAVRLLETAHRWAPDDKNLHRLLLETGVQRYGSPLTDIMIMPAAKLDERARRAFVKEDFKQATWLFEVLHMREPKQVEHLRCLAECYVRTGAKGRALECLREALKLAPGNKRIMRRIRKVSLPRWLRPLFPGKPFLS